LSRRADSAGCRRRRTLQRPRKPAAPRWRLPGHPVAQLAQAPATAVIGAECLTLTLWLQVAEVAAAYGFRSVVTPAALAAAHPPSMLPFSSRAIRAAWAAEVGGDESGSCERAAALGTAAAPIAAVLVFNDPVDW